MPETEQKLTAKYGLPVEVRFCRRCVMSNQRPASVPEFKHTVEQKKPTLHIAEDGICDACRYAEMKDKEVDWEARKKELGKLLDQYRRDDGSYDVLVPGSGGKDSIKAAHVLKYEYGMHPLTITWAPHLYTDIGWKNFRNWIDIGGFDNILFNPNGKVHRLLTKLAVENLFHPFQPFILGQKNVAPKMAAKLGLPLVFYGENEAEYGNPINENLSAQRDNRYFSASKEDLKHMIISGVSMERLINEYKLTMTDLDPYLPPTADELNNAKVDVRYLGYYIKWTPQENYYYAVEHAGFEANPERTEGSFSKYNSLDDKFDGIQFWSTYIKFGLGRTSYEASQEIRNHHLTREEGVALVRRFDGEFPKRYFKEILEYMDMTEERFFELADKFRSPHLWEKTGSGWKLRHVVS